MSFYGIRMVLRCTRTIKSQHRSEKTAIFLVFLHTDATHELSLARARACVCTRFKWLSKGLSASTVCDGQFRKFATSDTPLVRPVINGVSRCPSPVDARRRSVAEFVWFPIRKRTSSIRSRRPWMARETGVVYIYKRFHAGKLWSWFQEQCAVREGFDRRNQKISSRVFGRKRFFSSERGQIPGNQESSPLR